MAKGRDFDALQKRRMRAANLLRRGLSQSRVAHQLGVSRQSVSRWAGRLEAHGQAGLRKA
ncbi:MAG: helix-turn-helix domain-containing protein, partial [Gammaproteobacteria bacterium]|nr:helix-turn-helix domain-containing protein [Gammaproteobacteria bacterium]